MGRGVISYSIAYISGIYAGSLFPTGFITFTILPAFLLLVCYITRKHGRVFLIISHTAIAITGVQAEEIGRIKKESGYVTSIEKIVRHTSVLQKRAAEYLKTVIPDKNSHATLCAISIGEKGHMEKELKESFTKAGAMHVLALSGLHIGILFAIIFRITLPLGMLPYGKLLRSTISIAFIVLYSLASGCSPSVIRAATMILVYKIAEGTFRKMRNWDAIALSALVIGAISPLQTLSAGFQLSYAAVAGIALLHPICENAYNTVLATRLQRQRYTGAGLRWLWNSISISVCCQITTLPIALYHFGYTAPYYLISNIVAVPLATGILNTLTYYLALQKIPLVSDILHWILEAMLQLLNFTIKFISA